MSVSNLQLLFLASKQLARFNNFFYLLALIQSRENNVALIAV